MANENIEELNREQTYLIMIPGFEGHGHIFKHLGELLKVQALAVQFGADFLEDTIPGLAKFIFKQIKDTIKLKTKFYLLGYSFGVNVALELAVLIEKEGLTGVVYCLDSSPDVLKLQLNAYLGNIVDGFDDIIFGHMYHLITGQNQNISKELKTLSTENEKLELCMKKLKGLVSHSNEYLRSIINGAYKRINTATRYNPDFELESQIVLMKGIPHPQSIKLSNDYNLSKYTKHPVKIFDINSDHASAPQDLRVADIINKFLDPKLLKEYQEKNHCETYALS